MTAHQSSYINHNYADQHIIIYVQNRPDKATIKDKMVSTYSEGANVMTRRISISFEVSLNESLAWHETPSYHLKNCNRTTSLSHHLKYEVAIYRIAVKTQSPFIELQQKHSHHLNNYKCNSVIIYRILTKTFKTPSKELQ